MPGPARDQFQDDARIPCMMQPVARVNVAPSPCTLAGFQLHEPLSALAVMANHLGQLPHDTRLLVLTDEFEEARSDALRRVVAQNLPG